MGENSSIQWTSHTFNTHVGCEKVSPECDNCYAESGSRRLGAQHGLKLWQGDRFFTGENYWKQPVKWNRQAEAAGVRARVFCASYADVFERRDDLVATRARLLRLIEETPHLDWLLLTKRPEAMVELAAPVWSGAWPSNVWAGTTIGVRASIDRVEHLTKVPAAVRFLSMEPLLEGVSLDGIVGQCGAPGCDICRAMRDLGEFPMSSPIHWVIVGGESGPKARPFQLAWARSIRDACRAAGVAFFLKQLGAKPFDDDRPIHLKDSHGGNWDEIEFPADLRIRQFPRVQCGNGHTRSHEVSA